MGIIDMAKGFASALGIKPISGNVITNDGMKFVKQMESKAASALGVPASFLGTTNDIKKSKIRGKVPTRSQRQILVDNGVSEKEQELYLIQKISLVQEGKYKHLNQSSNKVENWTLVHRGTGELKEVYIA